VPETANTEEQWLDAYEALQVAEIPPISDWYTAHPSLPPRLVGRILLILVYPIKENDVPMCNVPVPGPVGGIHPNVNHTTLWHLTAR
jgi:hypothetical protein